MNIGLVRVFVVTHSRRSKRRCLSLSTTHVEVIMSVLNVIGGASCHISYRTTTSALCCVELYIVDHPPCMGCGMAGELRFREVQMGISNNDSAKS